MRMRILIGLLLTTGVAACDSPATPLTMQEVAGSYAAERCDCGSGAFGAFSLTTTANGVTTDWIEKGAFGQISLSVNGTTSGRVLVPGADEDGSDLDEDLPAPGTCVEPTLVLHDACKRACTRALGAGVGPRRDVSSFTVRDQPPAPLRLTSYKLDSRAFCRSAPPPF